MFGRCFVTFFEAATAVADPQDINNTQKAAHNRLAKTLRAAYLSPRRADLRVEDKAFTTTHSRTML
jgi:hypothetical protein